MYCSQITLLMMLRLSVGTKKDAHWKLPSCGHFIYISFVDAMLSAFLLRWERDGAQPVGGTAAGGHVKTLAVKNSALPATHHFHIAARPGIFECERTSLLALDDDIGHYAFGQTRRNEEGALERATPVYPLPMRRASTEQCDGVRCDGVVTEIVCRRRISSALWAEEDADIVANTSTSRRIL